MQNLRQKCIYDNCMKALYYHAQIAVPLYNYSDGPLRPLSIKKKLQPLKIYTGVKGSLEGFVGTAYTSFSNMKCIMYNENNTTQEHIL